MDFRDILFGMTDAHAEREEHPELLLNGYLDLDKLLDHILNHKTFLVLGYKGSGKSALSEHLELAFDSERNAEEDEYLVTQEFLSAFPYNKFAKIINGQEGKEVKSIAAWEWLLLTKILYILKTDNDASFSNEGDIDTFTTYLTRHNVYPLKSLSALVMKSSARSFQAGFKGLNLELSSTNTDAELSYDVLIDFLKDIIATCSGAHSHLLVIDGLDEILLNKDTQYTAIAALINVARDLNRFFSRNNQPLKIIILCRTDIFERLPDPNKNKMRSDYSFTLNWYNEGIQSENDNHLIELVNKRAKLKYPEIENVFTQFFPEYYENKKIPGALLEHTRHTPRDFLQLMNRIQTNCSTPSVTKDEIAAGIKDYSISYFLPEIKDEMAGYINYQVIDEIISVLASFRSREIEYAHLISRLEVILKNTTHTPTEVLKVLYDCSAIGQRYSYDEGETRFSFKYRNRNSTLVTHQKITIHKGLWKALNVNF